MKLIENKIKVKYKLSLGMTPIDLKFSLTHHLFRMAKFGI